MAGLPSFIVDLSIILIIAGVVSLLFKILKQPVMLGYIVAGILSGSSVPALPTVTNTDSVHIWAEIGVVFLLFYLGLEFSFKKLAKVGNTAVISALTILTGMMTLGFFTGKFLGWNNMSCLFLGGMLSMSSTTIIFKTFDDFHLRTKKFASVVFGILVVEDLFAIFLMVILSTLAVSKHVEGWALTSEILQLVTFLIVCFVVGMYFIPTFLKQFKKHLNDETLLIFSVGLCLGMVLIASEMGFSPALGAFLMGSLLAETLEAERISKIITPVKNLFGAIFFVSVGMLIDPSILWEHRFSIAVLTVVVMFGQAFFSLFGILLSGQSLRTAISSSLSLAQIGEFAFIIAALGLTLDVIDTSLYPVIVAVSVITTFFTPYMVRSSDAAYKLVSRHLPARLIDFLDRYSAGLQTAKQRGTWNKLLRALFRIAAIYTSVSIAAILLWLRFVSPLITERIPGLPGRLLSLLCILIIIAPMLRAIVMKKNKSIEYKALWQDRKFNRGPLISLILLRLLICVLIVIIPVHNLLELKMGVLLMIAGIALLLMLYSRRLKRLSILMERRFISNLSARDEHTKKHATIDHKFANNLLDRDLHLAECEVSHNSFVLGKKLKELGIKQRSNVNIVTIVRGDRRINIPGGEEVIYPYDKLIIVGSDTDIEKFNTYVEEIRKKNNGDSESFNNRVVIEQLILDESSEFIGLNIRQSGIRDRSSCLVIGVERSDNFIKNPDPSFEFMIGDTVWIAGERNKVYKLSESNK